MVLVAAPPGMELADKPTVAEADPPIGDGETPPPNAPSDAVAEGVTSADWSAPATSAKSSWLAIGMGTVATLAIVGSITAFGWMQWNERHVGNAPRQTETVEPAPDDQAGTEREEEQPESLVNDTLPVMNTEDQTPAQESAEPAQLVTNVVDVNEIFSDADTTKTSPDLGSSNVHPTRTDLTESVIPELTGPSTTTSPAPDALSNLARLLSGPNANVPEPATQGSAAAPAPESKLPEQIKTVPVTALANQSTHTGSAVSRNHSSLDVPVRAVNFKSVPLIDFVRTMMELSGVPIQVDPSGLEQTASTTETLVNVSAIDAPVGDILRRALEPRKLVAIEDGPVVRVGSVPMWDAATVSTSHFVGDLVSGKGRDLDLATLMATLVDPESWTTVGGSGTVEQKGDRLNITNTRLVTMRCVVLLEKLRTARKLKPRRKLPKHTLSSTPRWKDIDRYLRRRINMDVWDESPIASIFRELETRSGLKLLVDWAALTQAGIMPGRTATLHARERLASEVFTHFLDPSGLVLVPIGGNTVQITTNVVSESRRWLEVYSTAGLSEASMAKVEELMLQGAAALDSASETAIVLANSDVHRLLVQ